MTRPEPKNSTVEWRLTDKGRRLAILVVRWYVAVLVGLSALALAAGVAIGLWLHTILR